MIETPTDEAREALLDSMWESGPRANWLARIAAFEAAVRAEYEDDLNAATIALSDAQGEYEAKLAALREAAYDDGHHDGIEPHDDVGYCQHSGRKYALATTPAEDERT